MESWYQFLCVGIDGQGLPGTMFLVNPDPDPDMAYHAVLGLGLVHLLPLLLDSPS
jgi:hypothetical protein